MKLLSQTQAERQSGGEVHGGFLTVTIEVAENATGNTGQKRAHHQVFRLILGQPFVNDPKSVRLRRMKSHGDITVGLAPRRRRQEGQE